MTDNGSAVTLSTPNAIGDTNALVVTVTGVSNPGSGSQILTVSTSSDPTSSTSSPYTITGSASTLTSVTSPTFSASSTAGGATGVTYTLGFTTSATGSLVGGTGTVTLVAPEGTIFGGCPYADCGPSSTYTFTDLTNPAGSGSVGPGVGVASGQSIVTLTVPKTIAAGDQVELAITAVTNPPKGSGSIQFSTSSDLAGVSIGDSTTAASAVQSLTLSETSTAAGATGVTGTVGFTTSPTGTLIGGSSAVTLIAPGGTIFGWCPYSDCGPSSTYTFTDLTNPSGSGSAGPGVSVTGPIVSITVPNTIKAGDHVVLTVTAVTNPLAGPGNIEFTTSSDTQEAAIGGATTVPNAVGSATSFASSSTASATGVTYVAGFTASSTGGLAGGSSGNGGTINITAAPAINLSSASQVTITDLSNPVDSGTVSQAQYVDGGAVASYLVPEPIGNNDSVTIMIAGLTNSSSGEAKLNVSTSSDTVPVIPSLLAPMSGTVSFEGNPVSQAAVQACPSDGDPCTTTATNASGAFIVGVEPAAGGSYSVTANPPTFGVDASPATVSPIAIPGPNGASGVDVTLGAPPTLAPGVSIVSPSFGDETSSTANPIVFWQEPFEMEIQPSDFPAVQNVIATELIISGTNSTTNEPTSKVIDLGPSVGGLSTGIAVGSQPITVDVPSLYPLHGPITTKVAYKIAGGSFPGVNPAPYGLSQTQSLSLTYPSSTTNPTDPLPAYFSNLGDTDGVNVGSGSITGPDASAFQIVPLSSAGAPAGSTDCGSQAATLQLFNGVGSNPPPSTECGVGIRFKPLASEHKIYYDATLDVSVKSAASTGTATVPLSGCDSDLAGDVGETCFIPVTGDTGPPATEPSEPAPTPNTDGSVTTGTKTPPTDNPDGSTTSVTTDVTAGSNGSTSTSTTTNVTTSGTNPDGSTFKDTVSSKVNSDGTTSSSTSQSSTTTNSDGSQATTTIQENSNGTTTTSHELQGTNPDGSTYDSTSNTTLNANGTVASTTSQTAVETVNPDGSVTSSGTSQTSGTSGQPNTINYTQTIQNNPDGSMSTTVNYQSPNNTYTSTTNTVTNPDGSQSSTVTFQNASGQTTQTITTNKVENPDGSTVTTTTNQPANGPPSTTTVTQINNPDGSASTTTVNTDGSKQTVNEATNPDGSKSTTTTVQDPTGNTTSTQSVTQVQNPDGSTSTTTTTTNANGTTTTTVTQSTNTDGSTTTTTSMTTPDGTTTTTTVVEGTNPDGSPYSNTSTSVTSPSQGSENFDTGTQIQDPNPSSPGADGGTSDNTATNSSDSTGGSSSSSAGGDSSGGGDVAGGSTYVDPSGTVTTSTASGEVPVAGATVTLEQGASATGPFTAVASGSAVMSPGNRTNPDKTDTLGDFGWDVLAGYYQITASSPGCQQTTSPVLTVPPPETDLNLELSCTSPPARASTTTDLTSLLSTATDTDTITFTADVKGSGTPTGSITLNDGTEQIGAAPLANGTATLTLATLPVGVHNLTAVYSGDANNAPSTSSNLTETIVSPSAPTLTSIAVTPANPSITKGATQQFSATGTYSDASTADITSQVTWASGTTSVATITSGGLASGVGVGSSTITATLGSVSGNTKLTVTAPTLTSIAVTPANPSITKGATQQFSATGTYSDASTADITSQVTWASGTTSVATITSGGLASGVGVGSSTITATLGSVSGNTKLTVTAPTLTSIAVTPANPSITKGAMQQFSATGTYSDASTADITSQVTWASGTTSVATITSGGLASGVGVGSSTITATLGSVSGNTKLTVTAPHPHLDRGDTGQPLDHQGGHAAVQRHGHLLGRLDGRHHLPGDLGQRDHLGGHHHLGRTGQRCRSWVLDDHGHLGLGQREHQAHRDRAHRRGLPQVHWLHYLSELWLVDFRWVHCDAGHRHDHLGDGHRHYSGTQGRVSDHQGVHST